MAKTGAYASLSPNSRRVGQIVDISRGGIAFQYYDSTKGSEPITETDLFLSSTRHYVHKIPIKKVFDDKVERAGKPMRKCRVQFGEMSPAQAVQLDAFLWGNVDGGWERGGSLDGGTSMSLSG